MSFLSAITFLLEQHAAVLHIPNCEGWLLLHVAALAECILGCGILFGMVKPQVIVAVQHFV